jgi:hypothetical protein
MIVFEQRASTILFNVLVSLHSSRPFLLPAHVCPIVPLTFLKAGQPFEFVDISEDSLCMDEESVLSRLRSGSGRYAGVLFVRTYGYMGHFSRFFKAVKSADPDLIVIDDRCLVFPEFEDTLPDGVDIILYSTGDKKPVELGFGGLGILREGIPCPGSSLPFNPADLEILTRTYKTVVDRGERYQYTDSDWLDTSRPSVALDRYRSLVESRSSGILRHKQALNRIYSRELPESVQLPEAYQTWRFNIRVPGKEALLRRIFQEKLFASSHFAPLTGIFSGGEAPRARQLHERVVNLFNDHYFDEKRAIRLTRIIRDHLKPAGL